MKVVKGDVNTVLVFQFNNKLSSVRCILWTRPLLFREREFKCVSQTLRSFYTSVDMFFFWSPYVLN